FFKAEAGIRDPLVTGVQTCALPISVDGQTGCTFTWTVDGQPLATFLSGGAADDARVARASGTGNSTFEFRALDNVCHSVEVSAKIGRASCRERVQVAVAAVS